MSGAGFRVLGECAGCWVLHADILVPATFQGEHEVGGEVKV